MSRYVNLASNGSINLDIPLTEFLGLKNSELYYYYYLELAKVVENYFGRDEKLAGEIFVEGVVFLKSFTGDCLEIVKMNELFNKHLNNFALKIL